MRISHFAGVLALAAALATSLALGADAFKRVQLPRGVSVEIPRNWVVVDGSSKMTLEAFIESVAGKNESHLSYAANLYSSRDDDLIIALFNIRYYPTLEATQETATEFSKSDVDELDRGIHEGLEIAARKVGAGKPVAWYGTRAVTIGGVRAFVTEYERGPVKGVSNFRVRLVRVFNADKSFTITVSYDATQALLLRPITDHIILSMMAR